MMALLPSINQWSKGPVNQLVHDRFQSPQRKPRPFKINKVIAVHKVTSHFLDLRWIFRFSRTLVFNPTKFNILIPTKQTLIPGIETYPNINQNSAVIFLLPLAFPRKLWSMKCQFDGPGRHLAK